MISLPEFGLKDIYVTKICVAQIKIKCLMEEKRQTKNNNIKKNNFK